MRQRDLYWFGPLRSNTLRPVSSCRVPVLGLFVVVDVKIGRHLSPPHAAHVTPRSVAVTPVFPKKTKCRPICMP
jgi:hypothetical protein